MRYVPVNPSMAHLFPASGSTGHLAAVSHFVYNRDGMCAVQGCAGRNPTPPHHGVLRKSDVQGWQPKGLRCLIDTPFCLVQLCDLHHETALEPSRIEVANWMWGLYGDEVIEWLEWLPFKVHPLRGWLAGDRCPSFSLTSASYMVQ